MQTAKLHDGDSEASRAMAGTGKECSTPRGGERPPSERGGVKMYLIFAGERFYPSAGWEDFLVSCESLEKAMQMVEKMKTSERYKDDDFHWIQVVDLTTLKIVYSYGNSAT